MKMRNFLPVTLLLPLSIYSQVGINTTTPQSTFDVAAKDVSPTTREGIIAPRLTKSQLASKLLSTYGNNQTGSIVYVTDVSEPSSTAPSLSQTVSIKEVGYYLFTGTMWKAISANLYNTSGTLTDNRIVTQGTNTLQFTTSSISGFSVNNSVFSVDGSSNRVGVGTPNPTSILAAANRAPGGTIDTFSAGINNCGGACAQGTARNVTLYNLNGTNAEFAGIHFIPSTSPTSPSGASIVGFDRDGSNNYAGLQIYTRNPIDYAPRLTVRSSGNIGIGTINPSNRLHISGTDPLRLQGLQNSNSSVGILTVNSSGVVQLRNTASISAVRATGTVTVASDNSQNNINTNPTETFDNLSEFSSSTFTASTAGLYKIDFQINFPQRTSAQDGGDGYTGYAHINVNGTNYNSASTKVSLPEVSGNLGYNSCSNSVLVKLNAGDTVNFASSVVGSTAGSANITSSYVINIVRLD